MHVLGIDACLGHCSVALLRDDTVLASRSEAMARGHVERLAPMVGEVLGEAGIGADGIALIGVTRGPGGFTGARLGVAFARGLALGCGCGAVGVTTLEALAASCNREDLVVALDGRRGDAFVQAFRAGAASGEAVAMPLAAIARFVERHGSPRLIGPTDVPAIDPADVARIASRCADPSPPVPLYLRAPDAKAAVHPALR